MSRLHALGPAFVLTTLAFAGCGSEGGSNTQSGGSGGEGGTVDPYGGSSGDGGFGGTSATGGTAGAGSGGSGGMDLNTGYVKKLAVGRYHTCAILDGGGVRCNTVVPPITQPVRDIAMALTEVCVVFESGTVGCWDNGVGGNQTSIRPVYLGSDQSLANVVSITAGGHFCALTDAGAGYCWGDNEQGAIDPSDSSERISHAVSVGDGFAALKAGAHETCAIKPDQTLDCWGRSGVIAPAPSLIGVKDVALGRDHACAVLNDNTLWCWGENRYNELAYPTLENDDWCAGSTICRTPKRVYGLNPVVQAGAGTQSSYALVNTGSIYFWGNGNYGIGGQAYGLFSVGDLSGVKELVTNPYGHHACAVREDGAIWCWGTNDERQVHCGESWCPPTAISFLPTPPGASADPGGHQGGGGLDCSNIFSAATCENCVEKECCLKLEYCLDDSKCSSCIQTGYDSSCDTNLAFSLFADCQRYECYSECQ